MYSGMASNCVGASEVAKAVNAFSNSDQQARTNADEEDGIEDGESCIPGST